VRHTPAGFSANSVTPHHFWLIRTVCEV
jgi:hypothetical protein